MILSDAIEFIGGLRHGDRVLMTREGRQYEMTVWGQPTLSDGNAGDPESIGVTLTLGQGRWSTRVEAVHLAPLKMARAELGGQVELTRLTESPKVEDTATGNAPGVGRKP